MTSSFRPPRAPSMRPRAISTPPPGVPKDRATRVLLVDDLIATGGTAEAAVGLLREVGAEGVACAFVVALPELGGVARLERLGSKVTWLCEFAGE